MCTATHPFAYLNGKYCCHHNKEKVYKPAGKTCDGGAISIGSTCCKDNAYAACAGGKKCGNYVATNSMCTAKYPFAYLNGKYCCAHGTEKFYTPAGATCDGGAISIGSTCCKDNAYAACAGGKVCGNYKADEEFSPELDGEEQFPETIEDEEEEFPETVEDEEEEFPEEE